MTRTSRMYPMLIVSLAALVLAGVPLSAEVRSLFTGAEIRPSDAVVLFHGRDLSQWVYTHSGKPAGWKVKNGYMEVAGGNICTKQVFGDCQLHVEFWLPSMPDAHGQGKANSGVYLQGRYEVQVLDSYGLESRDNDCGAVYGVSAPMVNACRPPQRWQTYDIIFRAPEFDSQGTMIRKARLTVFQNGVLIQENVEVGGVTVAGSADDPGRPGPIMLQDHGNPVRYRNVWIRAL